MSDDGEYDDELPPICVNSSMREPEEMPMPRAEQLARERAREAECERELRLLRADDAADPALHTADSSGSEGEAALAAAVTRLRMRAAARAAAARPELLGALLARLPPAAALADAATGPAQDAVTDAMWWCVEGGRVRGAAAALGAAWLCAAAAGPARARRRAARRALHGMLRRPPLLDVDSEESRTLKAAVLDGVRAPHERLELADALAPLDAPLAPPLNAPLAGLLRRRLLAGALAELLGCEGPGPEEACLCAWAARAVGAGAARLAGAGGAGALGLRAVGRAVRGCGAPAACARPRAALLAALAQPRGATASLAPDRLEVLVGAAKLQLLIRDDK